MSDLVEIETVQGPSGCRYRLVATGTGWYLEQRHSDRPWDRTTPILWEDRHVVANLWSRDVAGDWRSVRGPESAAE